MTDEQAIEEIKARIAPLIEPEKLKELEVIIVEEVERNVLPALAIWKMALVELSRVTKSATESIMELSAIEGLDYRILDCPPKCDAGRDALRIKNKYQGVGDRNQPYPKGRNQRQRRKDKRRNGGKRK